MRESGGRGFLAELLHIMAGALRARDADAAVRRVVRRHPARPSLLHVTLDDQDVERALGNLPALRRALERGTIADR